MSNDTACVEARALYRMLEDENTVEELRELIRVPPKTEQLLRTFARKNPAEAHWIESAIKFRQAVAREFERLVREGVAVAEIPEVKELELDAVEESYVAAQP
jgi:hypothetical protein